MRTYTISELAREFDVTPRALRFYEDKDLLHPARNGMNRIYSHRDRGRLQMILRGKRIGLSLTEIREILDVYSLDGHEAQMKLMVDKFSKQIAKLERQRDDIDASIDLLNESILWIEKALNNMTSPDELAEQSARAFDRVARKSLDPELTEVRASSAG